MPPCLLVAMPRSVQRLTEIDKAAIVLHRHENGPAVVSSTRDPAHSRERTPTVDTTESSAPAHPSSEVKKLAKLEDQLQHELMDDEERQELRDRVLRLRRRLSR